MTMARQLHKAKHIYKTATCIRPQRSVCLRTSTSWRWWWRLLILFQCWLWLQRLLAAQVHVN